MATKALKRLLRNKGEIPERFADFGLEQERRAMLKAQEKRERRKQRRLSEQK